MQLGRAWGALALTIGGTGCGASTSHAIDGPSLTAVMACADLAHAVCSKRGACTNGFAIERNYGGEPTCEARVAIPCVTDLGATGTSATPETREACAQDYANTDSTCVGLFDNDPTPACTPDAGTVALGGGCGAPAQCASTYCAIARDQVCGTCQPLPAVGATCTVDADCGRGLACAMPAHATTGTCAAYVAENGACIAGVSPCQAGLSCVGEDSATATPGVCKPAVTVIDAACDGSRKTMAACDAQAGLACIPTAATSAVGSCQPIQLVGPNATCGQIGGPPITAIVDCGAGGSCVKAAPGDKTSTCVAPAADGAACDTVAGPPCLAPAKCVPTTPGGTTGMCTLRDATQCH